MASRIAGYILRAGNRDSAAEFYQALGLTLSEHKHGGPKHFEMAPHSPELVFELYQQSVSFQRDAFMLEVDSLDEVLRICEKFNVFPLFDIKETDTMRFAYVFDPDERSIMLFEKVQKPAS